jgi:hypothetical protein
VFEKTLDLVHRLCNVCLLSQAVPKETLDLVHRYLTECIVNAVLASSLRQWRSSALFFSHGDIVRRAYNAEISRFVLITMQNLYC